MLFEFHRCHKKKNESIYATYIITGERKVIEEAGGDEDEDEDMSGSPFEITPREKKEKFRYQKIVKLVGEERLEEVKAEIENIKTVHVYSLGPSRIRDLCVLSACSERVRSEFVYEDEQAAGRVYGMIVNHLAIKAPRPIRPPVRPHAMAIPTASKANEKAGTKEKAEAKSNPDTKTKAKHEPETKIEKKPAPAQMKRSQSTTKAAQKRQGPSNLFTSWSNAANKKAESNPSSTAHSPKTEEVSVRMDLDSEEESDSEPTLLRDAAEDARKRREKYDELTKMMEMSDDDEDIKPKPKRRVKEEVSEEEEEEAEEIQEVETPPESKPVELPAGSVVNAVTEGGRRRGRRKVNKKVQVKDEDGYLVTKFEPAWESFSEEEPVPKPKPKPKPAPKSKKKNAGPVTGQGSINSYFFKK
ncbi:DNA polymerase subunit Cdc27 [Tuber indicum]|nr:DNA polymerase subunit Cdc27 [Tuber indicum]